MKRKGIYKVKEVNRERRAVRAILTKRVVDRDGEVIEPSGVILDHFLQNPVLLWAHNPQNPPIGRWENLEVLSDRIEGTAVFLPEGKSARADEVWAGIEMGALQAFSIGFRVLKSTDEPVLPGQTGPTITKWELYEASAVAVPANPEALAVSFAKAFHIREKKMQDDLKTWFQEQNRKTRELEEKVGSLLDVIKEVTKGPVHAYLGNAEDLDLPRSQDAILSAPLYKKDADGRILFKGEEPVKASPDEVIEAAKLCDKVVIVDAILRGTRLGEAFDKAVRRWGFTKALMDFVPSLGERWARLQGKATQLISTTAGSGDEWVPVGMSATLFDEVRLACPEAMLFPSVRMPTNPWDWPKKTGVGQCYIRTEGNAPTASVLTTGKITFTAYTFTNYQQFSDEMNEDSIIAVADAVRADVIRSLAEGLSMAIINGDSDGANHLDYDYTTGQLGSAYPQNSAFSGLRQYALDANSYSVNCGGDALSWRDIASGLETMGKFSADRLADGSVILLVGPKGWNQLLTEENSPLVTRDKYGPGATILRGEMGRLFGVRIFPSFGVAAREDQVTTNGYNENGGTNTLKTAVLVDTRSWAIGDRRDVRIETDKVITSGINQVVSTARWGFQPMETSEPHTVALINFD